jgi:hypothetical protein
MDTMNHADPQLNALLSGFDNPDASEVRVRPNIKMTIKSNNAVSQSNNKGASTRITKCRGKLVRKGGKVVPKIQCSSMKLNSPNKKKERQAAMLQDILGEVNRQKQMPEVNQPLQPQNTNIFGEVNKGCGCSKQKRTSCGAGSHTQLMPLNSQSTMPIDMNEPPAVFNQATNYEQENTPPTKVKRSRRRRGKGKGKGKGNKNTHKVVQLSLEGSAPTIPEVRIKRKRRGSGSKNGKGKAKAKGKDKK